MKQQGVCHEYYVPEAHWRAFSGVLPASQHGKSKAREQTWMKDYKGDCNVPVAVGRWLGSSSTEPIPSGFGYSVRERKGVS